MKKDKIEKKAKVDKIHVPDCLTGFCPKCGKYAKVYGKYCSEISEIED